MFHLHQVKPKTTRLSILFIALVVPLCFSIHLEDGFELPQTVAVLAALSFLVLSLSWGDWINAVRGNGSLYLSAIAFLAAGVYSFIELTHKIHFYFPTQSYLWVLAAFLFLVPVGEFMPKRKFYAFLVAAGILGSLYSFSQALGFDLAGWSTRFGGRSFSTLGNPIFWAGHLLILLPLALYLALSSTGKGWKIFWYASLGILMLSLLTTQTRGAWLGFFGEVAALVALSWGKTRLWKGLMVGTIAFLLTVLAVPSLNERALSIFQTKASDAQGRYFLWEVALKQWKEKKVFGQGPGGYAGQYHRIQSRLTQKETRQPYQTAFHAHQDYFEVLAERGIVGALLGLLIVWMLLKRRWVQPSPGEKNIPMGSVEIAVMVGIGIHALFNFPLSVVPTACALALLFNPSWDRSVQPEEVPAGLFTEPRVIIAIVALTACGLAFRVMAQNGRLHRAVDEINGQRYEEALKTLNFNPSVDWLHYLDPRVFRQRAAALDAMGSGEEAAETWRQVTLAYPYDADAFATLCMLYGKQERWSDAQGAGIKALTIAPTHEQALNNMAMVCYLMKKKREAIRYLSFLEKVQTAWGETQAASETHQKISALKRRQ